MPEPVLPEIRRFASSQGIELAYRHAPGRGPLIVFLPGYMSDMAGGKATAVMEWAMTSGHACLLLDYSGCGDSDGDFADGTLTRWRDEVIALIDHAGADMPIVLIGSSMGGWLMLLVAEALTSRKGRDVVKALVGIAAAPDFPQWGYSPEQRAALDRGETWFEANIYGPDPTPYHPAFHQDAKQHVLLERGVALTCPVRLLQGQCDPDVPWQTALRLCDALASQDVRVDLIKDADHRLSRDQDIALLLATVSEVSSWR